MSKIIDPTKNGTILPEQQVKRVMIRINSTTLIFPKASKVKNKYEYAESYIRKIKETAKKY